MNETPPQPPTEPEPPQDAQPPAPPPTPERPQYDFPLGEHQQPQQPYAPPPLPPGYEQHYRPIHQPQYVPKPPGNDSAMASIIVACTSIGFLILSAGLLAPLTLIASAIAIPLGHKGKENVDQGKTQQNRDIAVAGFWTGIGGVALSVIALIAWIVIVIVLLSSDFTWTDDSGQMHHWSMD